MNKSHALVNYKLITDISCDSKNTGLYLTFDLDWCHEGIFEDTLSLLTYYGAKATFFATGHLPVLNEIVCNPSFEVGIHPNYNGLLHSGKAQDKALTAQCIIAEMMDMFPAARSIRSHSLVQSPRLSQLYVSYGLTHESNIKVPLEMPSRIMPFMHSSGIIMCPYHWGDYADLNMSIKWQDVINDYFVVNFHPIHVFLNTESLDRYERTRPLHQNPKELVKHRYEGFGTRSRLIELLELCKQP